MQPVKIIVKAGIGREVPYMPQTEEEAGEAAQDYFINGSSASISYPCPELSDTKPGETVEATQIMQERLQDSNDDWVDCVVDGYDPIYRTGYEQQVIWKLIPEQKGLDLNKLAKETDKFLSEQTTETYNEMFKEMDAEQKQENKIMVDKASVIKILEDTRIMAVKNNSHAGDYIESVLYNIIQEIESLTPPTLK